MVNIHIIQFIIGLVTLVAFSIIDIKTLQINNKLILLFWVISMIANTTLILFFGYNPISVFIGLSITFLLAFTLAKIKYFGGADYKILLGLGLLTNHEFMIPFLTNMLILSIIIKFIVKTFHTQINKIIKLKYNIELGIVGYPYIPVLLLTFLLTIAHDNLIINLFL